MENKTSLLFKVKNRLLVKVCINEISTQVHTVSQYFYKELFHIDINMKNVFPGDVMFLNRKFINMLATFKNVKDLESMTNSVEKIGERHALQYGVEIRHIPVIKQALLAALSQHLGNRFNSELKAAWIEVFDDVTEIMKRVMTDIVPTDIEKLNHDENSYDSGLYEEIGGETVIYKVHQHLYDALFDEPWLEKFFYGKDKDTLIEKQTQFMTAALNGPNNYRGDTPAFVHMHMFITDEMADVRETLLKNAIYEQGLSESVCERWLKVDRSFRPAIVKNSVDECVMKCVGQVPVVAIKPLNYSPPVQRESTTLDSGGIKNLVGFSIIEHVLILSGYYD